jgi:UDP-glucose 4-epimerase
MDLAEGHLHALSHLKKGSVAVNIGTGTATSVLEIVAAFQMISGVKIPYEIVDRRAGDLADVYADASRAKELFGWSPKRGLNQMVEDIWRWQKNNPNGFDYC